MSEEKDYIEISISNICSAVLVASGGVIIAGLMWLLSQTHPKAALITSLTMLFLFLAVLSAMDLVIKLPKNAKIPKARVRSE